MSQHPALKPGNTAVVTGAASGIGLAAAKRFAGLGMNVVLVDLAGAALQDARSDFGDNALAVAADVSRFEDLEVVREATLETFGAPHVLMNNAGMGRNPGGVAQDLDAWKALIGVNFWGVVHGVQAFLPGMIEGGGARLVINTGSKQGITTPPGNAAYNVSKAAVKAFSEATAHELRNTSGAEAITAHLLIPGSTWTGMTSRGRAEKPPGAWTPDQVVDFLLESLERGDFYILCPDGEVTRETDEKRMAWAMGDLIENRPALSRWHPDFAERFAEWMKS